MISASSFLHSYIERLSEPLASQLFLFLFALLSAKFGLRCSPPVSHDLAFCDIKCWALPPLCLLLFAALLSKVVGWCLLKRCRSNAPFIFY
jgi:hypothetical protein